MKTLKMKVQLRLMQLATAALIGLLALSAMGCSTMRGLALDLYHASSWVEEALRANDQQQSNLELASERNPNFH